MPCFIKALVFSSFLLLLCSCSAIKEFEVSLDTIEPLRVAVLPFYQRNEDGQFINASPNLFFVDNLPGVVAETADPPAVVVEKLVTAELENTAFDIIPPGLVRSELVHHRYFEGMSYDYGKILQTSPKALAKLLSADAILYGELTEWDRSYYGLQSSVSVGVSLKLVRGSNGKELYRVTASDTDSKGLSKGPTGYFSLIVEPIKGLSEENVVDLARRVAREAIKPLRVDSRPDYLDSPRPVVYASAHDATNGVVERNSALTVVMIGSAGHEGSFSIGKSLVDIPMAEVALGHYLGEFFPLRADNFSQQTIYVTLRDRFGRVARQPIGLGPVTLR